MVDLLPGSTDTQLRATAPAGLEAGAHEVRLTFASGEALVAPEELVVLLEDSSSSAPPEREGADAGGWQPVDGGAPEGAAPDGGLPPDSIVAQAPRRRRLTLSESFPEVVADLTVAVRAPAFGALAMPLDGEGRDLWFADAATGAPLPHEIEHRSPERGLLAWVRLPELEADAAPYSFYVYYGVVAGPPAAAEGAWSSEFVGVWHFEDRGADSTWRRNDASSVSATVAAGALGRQLDFGGGRRVEVGAQSSLGELFAGGGTISAWFSARSWGIGSIGRVLDKAAGLNAQEGWSLELKGNVDGGASETLRFEHGFSESTGGWVAPSGSIALSTAHYVLVSYDQSSAGDDPVVYIDGILQGLQEEQTPRGEASSDVVTPLWFGDFSGGPSTRSFDGTIDEIRLARALRNGSWARADYLSVSGQLLTMGPTEVAPANP